MPAAEHDPANAQTGSAAAGAASTILVVEDEEQVRALVASILRRAGYQAQVAADAEAALEMLPELASIELLITDITMPGITGVELYERLVEQRPGLRVLFMSGYSGNLEGHYAGIEDGGAFIAKPFSVQVFQDKVREILQRETFTRLHFGEPPAS